MIMIFNVSKIRILLLPSVAEQASWCQTCSQIAEGSKGFYINFVSCGMSQPSVSLSVKTVN